MVYVRYKEVVGFYYLFDRPDGRKNIIYDATTEAEAEVKGNYSYGIYRMQQELARHAEKVYQQWTPILDKDIERRIDEIQEAWHSERDERKHIYISAFIAKYMEEVAEKDKKEGKTPAISTAQGATLTLKQVERKADEYVYYIELADPGYIDGVQTAEVVYPVGEEKPIQTSSSYGSVASYASPSYQTSSTSQKSGGSRLYVRNVKKK